MTDESPWVLVFDSGCARCTRVADIVERESRGLIDVVPPSSQQARSRLGLEALALERPVLIERRSRAFLRWQGPLMAIGLLRAIGLKRSVRVVSSLGDMRTPTAPRGDQPATRRTRSRLFLGGLRTGSLLLAQASRERKLAGPDPATLWAAGLSQTALDDAYAAFTSLGLPYRRAVFSRLDADKRSSLWVAHLSEKRAQSHLTDRQEAALDYAIATAGDRDVFRSLPPSSHTHEQLQQLREDLLDAFGAERSADIAAMIGPLRPSEGMFSGTCSDSVRSRPHGRQADELEHPCNPAPGCGTFWLYECDTP